MKNLLTNKLLLIGAVVVLCGCQPDKKNESKTDKCCSSLTEEKAPVAIQETVSELQSQPAAVEEPVAEEVSIQSEAPVTEEASVQSEVPAAEEVSVQSEAPVSDEISVQNEVPAPEVLQAMPQTQMSEVSVTPASEEVKVEEVQSEVSQTTEVTPAAQ